MENVKVNRITFLVKILFLVMFISLGLGVRAYGAVSMENWASINNPAFPGEGVLTTGSDYNGEYDYTVRISNVIRGSEAENYALQDNMYNEIPYGAELFIFDVEMTLNYYYEGYVDLYQFDFTGFTSSKASYDPNEYILLNDQFEGTLYNGGTMKGKAYVFAPYGDSPYVEFNPFYGSSVFYRLDPYLPEFKISSFSTGGKTELSAGETITLSASATGGNTRWEEPYYYKFESIDPSGQESTIKEWSTSSSSSWTPDSYGVYTLYASAVDNGDGYTWLEKEITVKPKTPINIKATSPGATSAMVTWDSISGVDGYIVERATSAGGPFAADYSSTNSYTFDGLDTGTKYYFRVKSYVFSGGNEIQSNYSSTASVIPTLSAPPNFNLSAIDSSSNRLTWDSVQDASGYAVYYSNSNQTGTFSVKFIYGTSFEHVSIPVDNAYYYKVRAFRTIDGVNKYGTYSSTKVSVPVPSDVVAESSSYNAIQLKWSPINGASGYQISRATSPTGSYSWIATTTDPNYMHTGLTSGSVYYYKIRAFSLIGTVRNYGNFSSAVNSIPVPTAPATINSSAAGYDSITITWSTVSGATGYQLYRSTSLDGPFYLTTTRIGTTYTHAGLTTGNNYFYKVRAYRTVGTTKVYGPYSALTTAKPAPTAPIDLSATSVGYDSINLKWSPVTGATGYQVYRSLSSTGTYSLYKTTTSTSYLNNTYITTGKAYYYKVRAYTTVGTINVYGDYSVVTNGKAIPATPANFSAVKLSSSSIKTTWNAVSGATGYQVYRATSSTGSYTLYTTTSNTSYTNSTNITSGKTYYYKVRAYRTVGTTKVYGNYTAVKSVTP